MCSIAVTADFGAATTWLPRPNIDFFRRQPLNEIDATPVSLNPAAPTLREAVLRFSGTFHPIHDQDTVRVVRGGGQYPKLIADTHAQGLVFVVTVGETSQIDPQTADPLAVFDRLQTELAVTQKELFAATGIKHRTYHSWKNPSAPRPRPSSLGRLWRLADTMVDLREALDQRSVAAWLHSSPERMAAFKAGRFEDLLDLAVAMPKPAQRAYGMSRNIGVAVDVGAPIVKTVRPKVTVTERGARR
jgi:uncharacterized protein (DUF2384 family)